MFSLYICAPQASGAQEGRVSDPLGFELQTAVSHYTDAGNLTQVLC